MITKTGGNSTRSAEAKQQKGNTVLDSNKAWLGDPSYKKNKDLPFLDRLERSIMDDFSVMKGAGKKLAGGDVAGAGSTLWGGMRYLHGGSRAKSIGKLGMYGVGASAVLDFVNPLGFGWGD